MCEADSQGWIPFHILVDDLASALVELTDLGLVLIDPDTGHIFPTRSGDELNRGE